jgi:hypothetical protein
MVGRSLGSRYDRSAGERSCGFLGPGNWNWGAIILKNIAVAVVVVIVLAAAYLGYRYWQIQGLAAKYSSAKEIASATIHKDGKTWTMHIESVIGDPMDAVWKALRQPERSAELVPAAFKRSAVVKDEGNKKSLDLQVTLLSLPAQSMLAELDYDDTKYRMHIKTSKGLQDIVADYQLSSLAPDRTLLVFAGTAVENVTMPVPQSVIEGALRELFVMQVRAIQGAIHGAGSKGSAAASAAPGPLTGKFCTTPPGPDTSKQVIVTVGRAADAAAPAAAKGEFRNDTADGYERGYSLDGIPVHETFRTATRCTTATATAGKFTVQVQSVILSPDSLEGWVKQVNWKALAALAGEDEKQLVAAFPPAPRGWNVVPPDSSPTLASPLAYQVYEQGLF